MKPLIRKPKLLIISLVLGMLWSPAVFAGGYGAPLTDANVPTTTPTPTVTPLPTAPPPPTETPTTAPDAAAPTEEAQAPTEAVQTDPTQAGSNVAEATGEDAAAVAAGSSVLGFLLCAGLIIVVGLAALNIWARRRP